MFSSFPPSLTSSVIYRWGDPEEQTASASDCSSPWWSELQGSWNVGIPKVDQDTEETRETHNFYIEKTRESLKNIIKHEYLMYDPWYSNLIIHLIENDKK